MRPPKHALLAAVIGVLLGLFVTVTPAPANFGSPGSGTLTWSSPAHR